MALNKVYSRINWENSPSTKTALNEDNLNRIDYAVNEIDNRVLSLDTTKADKSETLQLLAGWTMDEKTGIITVTKKNGDKLTFDLNVEKVPVDFSLSADGILTMMTADGTKFSADIGSMIPVMTFQTSDTIAVSVTGSGQEKTYSFSVKPGSITEDKLQPNYLSDVRTAASAAQTSAQAAKGSEDTVKADADRASAAATAAEASKTAAAKSQTAAKASQDAAKASETASAASKAAAETAAATATQKATAASNSAATATQKEASAVKAASDALSSARIAEANAQTATDSSIEAKSYAIGGTGTRIGEDTDNAKHYYEQAKLQANVPTKLSQLQNDTGFITVAVDNLVHYYTSSQLYTKSEVDQKLSAIPKFAIVAVTALPTANISSTTIYLLKEGSAGNNKCSEWVYVSGAWEKLGDIDVDLSGYLTKTGDGSSLTEAFSEASALAKLTSGEKHSALFGKLAKAVSTLISHVTTAATTSVLGHVKVDSAMSSTSTNPVQNKVVNTALAGKLATTGNASNTTVAYTEAAALTELASGEKQSVAFGKLKLAVKNVISIARLLGSTDISAIGGGTVTGAISALNSNLADARNVKLQLSGGDDVLSDQIYANWSQVPIGYGCIRVGNGSTVRSGTYIKHSDMNGAITLNRADGGTTTIWSVANGTVKSMPTETYGIIPDAGVNVGFSLRLKQGVAYVAIDVVVPQMAAWSSFRLGYIPEWTYGVKVLGTAHSILSTQSSSVRIDISEAGVVTVNTQAAIAGNQWFYGRNSVYL